MNYNFINELYETKKEYVIDLLQLYNRKDYYIFLNVDIQIIY